MQWVIRAVRALGGVRYGTDTGRGMQRWLGLAGLIVVMIVLAASAVIYIAPIGKRTYTALLTDAGSVQPGDEVRIAGIAVGAVKTLALTDDAVRMSFTVTDGIAVGDTTTIDIRMLTPVGGHYLALHPSGSTPLGATPIPATRVHLPYNLMQAIQDSQRPVAGIDAGALHRSLADLTASLSTSPGSVHTLTQAMATLVGMLNRQSSDVSRALTVADEYLTTLGNSRSVIGAMLDKLGLMETQLLSRRDDVTEALRVVAQLLSRIAALDPAWRTQLEPLADRLLAAEPQLDELGRRLGQVVGNLTLAGDRLRDILAQHGITIDESDRTVSARAICVPVPGRGC